MRSLPLISIAAQLWINHEPFVRESSGDRKFVGPFGDHGLLLQRFGLQRLDLNRKESIHEDG